MNIKGMVKLSVQKPQINGQEPESLMVKTWNGDEKGGHHHKYTHKTQVYFTICF